MALILPHDEPRLLETVNGGTPVVLQHPGTPVARAIEELARRLHERVSLADPAPADRLRSFLQRALLT